ncbi:MAG: PAS domain-containing protein [Candidatus Eisenbacteria bacterium]
MIGPETMVAVLDSLKDPLMFVDMDHIIRYMNKVAAEHHDGGEALLDTSVLDCHNEQSNKVILEVAAAFETGEDERLISDTDKSRVYMRVVRSPDGKALGYYERYAPPAKQGDSE